MIDYFFIPSLLASTYNRQTMLGFDETLHEASFKTEVIEYLFKAVRRVLNESDRVAASFKIFYFLGE